LLTGTLGITILALASSPAAAQGLTPAGRTALSKYTLTEPVLNKILAINRAARARGIDIDDGMDLGDKTLSLEDLTAEFATKPAVMTLIKAQGMNTRQFVLGELALGQVAMAARGGIASQFAEKLMGEANPANIAFYKD